MELYEMLERMIRLSVWDHAGRMYTPIFGYDGQVEVYAPAHEAADTNIAAWWEDNGYEGAKRG